MDQNQRKPINKKKVVTSIITVSALAGTGYGANRSQQTGWRKGLLPCLRNMLRLTRRSMWRLRRFPQVMPGAKSGTINDVSCLNRSQSTVS
jgi:hypothetical protein